MSVLEKIKTDFDISRIFKISMSASAHRIQEEGLPGLSEVGRRFRTEPEATWTCSNIVVHSNAPALGNSPISACCIAATLDSECPHSECWVITLASALSFTDKMNLSLWQNESHASGTLKHSLSNASAFSKNFENILASHEPLTGIPARRNLGLG